MDTSQIYSRATTLSLRMVRIRNLTSYFSGKYQAAQASTVSGRLLSLSWNQVGTLNRRSRSLDGLGEKVSNRRRSSSIG